MRSLHLRLAALALCAVCTAWTADNLTPQAFINAPDLAAARLAPWLAQAPADEALGLLRNLPPLPAGTAERVMDDIFAAAGGAKLRRALLGGLRSWPDADAALVDRVAAALRDDDAGVREAAIDVLRSWRPERTAPALAVCISDPVPRVATQARRVLTEWAGHDLGLAPAWVAWATDRVARSEALCARFAERAASVDAAQAPLLIGDIVHAGALREDREAILLTLAKNPDRRIAELAEEGLRRIAPPGVVTSSGSMVATDTAGEDTAVEDTAVAASAPASAPVAAIPAARQSPTASGDAPRSVGWMPLVAVVVVALLGLAISRVIAAGKARPAVFQSGSFAVSMGRNKKR